MIRELERKFLLTQAILLGFFVWGVGFLYDVSTMLFNSAQLRWELYCFAWESLVFGVPLIVFRPIFRPILQVVQQLEAGATFTSEQAAALNSKILSYPFKVALLAFFGCTGAYALGVVQVRYFAQLPWEGVIITLICGVTSGLLWGVLEYFLLEHFLRPLTGLVMAAAPSLPAPRKRVSLRMKIFVCSLTLVLCSLSFFGIVAYTRAAHVLEQEIGGRLTGRMREFANLIGTLPQPEGGGISAATWMLAAEFPVSPRGYEHIIDLTGDVLVTHPTIDATRITHLRDEGLLPEIQARVLTEPEGFVVDRVGRSRMLSYVTVPGTKWKVVAIAPLGDFSPQLDQLLYAGLAGMALALFLSLVIGFLCARSITTSVREVTRVAQGLAEKRDLTQRVRFVTNDEVGVLAHAFNQMAQGLQTYAEELEQLVAARTTELRLRGAQLEAKNAELSDFLYIASHDLRAPLINLSGFSHVLQEDMGKLETLMQPPEGNGGGAPQDRERLWPQLKADMAESVDFILRSTAKMDVLVSALLELSRIGTRPHQLQRIDTRQLVQEILDASQFQIAAKQISVHVGVLPEVLGDALRINQVFSNLIDNAIKYMPQRDGARIEIGCETHDAHHFYVRDNGPGIRRADQSKVFRPFTRLGANGVPGDGVGLAAVHKIVEKHGGKVWVVSELGAGSTFWFTLPQSASVQAVA